MDRLWRRSGGPIADRHAPALAAALTSVTAAVYLIGANRGLSHDGAVTVGNFVANHEFWSPFRRQVVFNNHPLFSFADHLVYLSGGRSELALVVLPALCGALGVGILAGWLSVRTTLRAGLAAGALLATNPTYVDLSRTVRGYTLMTTCVIVATILLVEMRERRPWFFTVAYVACMSVAIGTHLYATLALVLHAVFVLASRRLSFAWAGRWALVTVLGLAPYVFIAETMLEWSRTRTKTFYASFPWETVRMALGTELVAVFALLPLVAFGCWRLRRSLPAWAVAAVAAAMFGIIWLQLKPHDLYPRFLLPLAAAAAVAVALAVTKLPDLVWIASVGVAVVAMVGANASVWSYDPGYRAASGIAQHVVNRGGVACVGDFYGEAFVAYGISPRAVSTASEFATCDVLFVDRDSGDLSATAARQYPHGRVIGRFDAFARDAALLDAPPATIPQ